jgi:predicted HTH transcriptional regulator
MKSGIVMTELEGIISEGEGQFLDFKFRIDDQKKISRTLAAFANSGGGRLLIGVKDSGKIVGTDPEEEHFMIEGAADLFCKPKVEFESKIWKEKHHLVLEIDVGPSDIRHKAITEDGGWKPYYRLEDKTVKGNKILDKFWMYKRKGVDRPETFTEEQLELLKQFKDGEPISISKLYRSSKMKMNQIDQFVAALLTWGVIEISVTSDGVRYYLQSE